MFLSISFAKGFAKKCYTVFLSIVFLFSALLKPVWVCYLSNAQDFMTHLVKLVLYPCVTILTKHFTVHFVLNCL